MADPADEKRLAELERRISAMKGAAAAQPKRRSDKLGQASQGWRMVVELVTGILIGTGMGYGLDVLFGTSPWFLVPFTLLGFAAGVNVMLQTAKELQRDNAPPTGSGTGGRADDEDDDEDEGE